MQRPRCNLCGTLFEWILGDWIAGCVHCSQCGRRRLDRAGIWRDDLWWCNVHCKQAYDRFTRIWMKRPDLQASVSNALANAVSEFPLEGD